MRKSSLGFVTLATLTLAIAGCESMNGDKNGGAVKDRDQSQHTNPDGSQVRTRSQVRETPSGETVRETETQKREVVKPGTGTAQ